ncbi:MAG TPA: class I SAM-dependent methyltransferase [Mycobacteriales bacterium]|nr:class I SAM-dependent methyltransferase [Mycobacteriales bacterium]
MTESAHDWDQSYERQGHAPWDIGRPQAAFVALADAGRLRGEVLDAGCGTGEHALLVASRGGRATGVDVSQAAIRFARQKAVDRALDATFEAGDILTMTLPGDGFDTVIDSGLFHVFDDEQRAQYVEVLAGAVRPGGSAFVICFSDRQPGDWGPRRVTRDELEAAFADGWAIEQIEPALFDINPVFEIDPAGGLTTASAWLAEVRRT